MDIPSLIIGICSLALFIVPLIYVSAAQNRKNKRLQKEFLEIAKNNSLSINKLDLWNNSKVIGIDTEHKKLLYLDKQKQLLIDLSSISKCRIGKSGGSSNGRKDAKAPISKIELIFSYSDKKQPELALTFFNSNDNLNLNGELPLAEKWQELINGQIQSRADKINFTAV